MQIIVPDLWDRIFTPGYVAPGSEEDMGDIMFASTDDEFDAIMAQLDAEEEEARRLGLASRMSAPATAPPADPSASPPPPQSTSELAWPPPPELLADE